LQRYAIDFIEEADAVSILD